jgi:uncharacterized protein YkvS
MIDKSIFYKFIYVSISFLENPIFAKGLKEKFNVEIPFIDLDCLNIKLKDSLDSYFYIEDNEKFMEIYKNICKKHPKISFTVLGSIRGKDIFSFFTACKEANLNTVRVGNYVKIIEGALKNMTAKVSKVEGEYLEIEFTILNTLRKLELHVSEVILQENYTPLELNKFRNMELKAEKQGNVNAIIIDGNNCLLRSMVNTPNKYNSKNVYIGGFMGFFFSLLKVKEFYPEYKIYVAFNSSEKEVIHYSEKVRKAYLQNLMWCQKLVEALGFCCCYSTEVESKEVIYTLLGELKGFCREILIYSTNEVFFPLINPQVSIYYPKITYRGNSEFITQERIPKLFGFKDAAKIKWALALHGGTEIPVVSISEFFINKYGPKQNEIKYVEYSALLYQSETEEELLAAIQKEANFSLFTETLKENLRKLTFKENSVFNKIKVKFDSKEAISLLEEVEMYKEIELWDRTERIFKGLW